MNGAPCGDGAQAKESVPQALRQFGAPKQMPHTLGIVLLGCVSYASFISRVAVAGPAAGFSGMAFHWCKAATWRC